MPLARLFVFLFGVISFCAVPALSQTVSAQNSNEDFNLIHFDGAASMSVAENAATHSPVPSDAESNLEVRDRSNHGVPVRDPQFLGTADCLTIRSYRVVRDDPHSDSTHRDGYTTCVPAARFRLYSTTLRGEDAVSVPGKP